MCKLTFPFALSHISTWEGGFSLHKWDPGGATNHGITRKTLSAWRGYKVSVEEVRALTPEEAGEIYRKNYWDRCRCHSLPPALAFAVFDSAVNQGTGGASKCLQKAVGAKVDGQIGPKTINLVQAAIHSRGEEDVLLSFCARRGVRYSWSSIFKIAGFGWLRRLLDTHQKAHTLLKG